MKFEEINKSEIKDKYIKWYVEDTRYFNIIKDEVILCIYGVTRYTDSICEAFWIKESFHNKVFTKGFFVGLFNHLFGLGYRKVYTCTGWDKLRKVFNHFKYLGIEETDSPIFVKKNENKSDKRNSRKWQKRL